VRRLSFPAGRKLLDKNVILEHNKIMPAQDHQDHHAHPHHHGHGHAWHGHAGHVHGEHGHGEHRHDEHRHRAEAQEPTLSLLRASAVQRLAGVAVLLAALWVIVMAVIR
jgi:NADH-quinone oxidoreductase subunit L